MIDRVCVTAQALREVVGKCLDKNPEARPTAAELLKHKCFKVHSLVLMMQVMLSFLHMCIHAPAAVSTPFSNPEPRGSASGCA